MPKTQPKLEKITSFADIGEQVMAELNRRLGDEEKAAELPGTLLMRLAEQYLKFMEKQQQLEEEKLKMDAEHVSVVEYIDKPGLSSEMKLEIAMDYNDQLEAEWRELTTRILALRKELGYDAADGSEDDPAPEQDADVSAQGGGGAGDPVDG